VAAAVEAETAVTDEAPAEPEVVEADEATSDSEEE
jgi:hypothetical protein